MNKTDGCVKFNKNSWHYRMADYIFWIGGHRTNLCPYMRMVVVSIFLLPFVAGWRQLPDKIQNNAWLIQGELIFLFLVMIVGAVVDYGDVDGVFPPWIEIVGYGFLGGNMIGLIGMSVLVGITTLVDYIQNRPHKEHRTRGLLKTYMKSKHDKICPCVEFEDEKS